MEEIIINTSKKAYVFNMLHSIIWGIIGFAGFFYKDNLCQCFSNNIILSNKFFWIFWVLMFGIFIGVVSTVSCIYCLFKPNKFVIKLNRDGFITPHFGFVAWNNISNLNLDKIQGSNYITFDIKEGELANKCPNLIFSNPYVIALFNTGVNAKNLYNTMQQYLIKAQQL